MKKPIDLSKCKVGDKLISANGDEFIFVRYDAGEGMPPFRVKSLRDGFQYGFHKNGMASLLGADEWDITEIQSI
jgi:hypothetical protein